MFFSRSKKTARQKKYKAIQLLIEIKKRPHTHTFVSTMATQTNPIGVKLLSRMKNFFDDNLPVRTGDIVTIPKGTTLFHGTVYDFPPESMKPWSWFSTNVNPPIGLIGEKVTASECTGDTAKVFEYETKMDINLLVVLGKIEAPAMSRLEDVSQMRRWAAGQISSPYRHIAMEYSTRLDKLLTENPSMQEDDASELVRKSMVPPLVGLIHPFDRYVKDRKSGEEELRLDDHYYHGLGTTCIRRREVYISVA
jgi:hypothetical protein